MNQDFPNVLAQHLARYPQMQPQDFGKLAFQSEFGPEHLVTDREKALGWIINEYTQAAEDVRTAPESIGNGLCRYHLAAMTDPERDAEVLTDLFIRTAKEHQGTQGGLAERLSHIEGLDIPGMTEWLEAYREKGCPAVHHSAEFNALYHPHYRLLKAEYALYFPAIARITALLKTGKPVTVAVDGRCGSGKTTLSALLQKLFSCNVFHMDDFYLPFEQRAENWQQIPAGNMELERFKNEILCPVKAGQEVHYRKYDCQHGVLHEAERFAPTALTVIDGSYSHHPTLAERYDLKIFLTCGKEEQARRLRIREGEYYEIGFVPFWIPMEERYHAAFAIEENSDLVIDTGIL